MGESAVISDTEIDGRRPPPHPDGAERRTYGREEAEEYCRGFASARHENFPVASRVVSAELRPHLLAAYAFARTADDFADEPEFEGRRVEALETWEQLLVECYHGQVDHPVFSALGHAIRECELPITEFRAMLGGFRADVARRSYRTFDELRRYCAMSAQPIGRVVLMIHGLRDPTLYRFSDDLCAALQITNMLQDLRVDISRGQHYLPDEDLVHFGVRGDDLRAGRATRAFEELIRFSAARARSLYARGRPLLRRVEGGLALELEMTFWAGMSVLDRVEARPRDVLTGEAGLHRRDLVGVAARSFSSFARNLVGRRRRRT